MKKYLVFDKYSGMFKEATSTIWNVLRFGIIVVLVSVSFTILGYALMSLVFNTRTEKELKARNEALEQFYAEMSEEEQEIGDVITGLQLKDAYIYEQVFRSPAPNFDPVGNLDFLFGSDTIPDRKLVSYTAMKAAELESRADKVDSAFARIFEVVCKKGFVAPPMSLPLDDITYPQVGAGAGVKIQPFYKTEIPHNGLDLIAAQGEPVYATADGVVTGVSRSSRGEGNSVEILHSGGYRTRYEHLSDIYVSKGQTVSRARRIGSVGMSGQSFAPHLHYEVMAGTVYLNPINYIFASVSPDEYSNMLFMAANTLQSMD